MSKKFDLFVIGGGSGGVRAARYAASKGIKTGLAEGWDLGGTCVNRGCVPKKLYSYSSHFSEDFKLMESFGWTSGSSKFNWLKLVKNKKKEISRLNGIYKNLLKDSKVEIFSNYASFVDSNSLRVGQEEITAKNFLISVGTKPRKLKFSASKNLISSDDAFDLKKLPRNLLILGGGYIAVEFASIFNGLGVDTTICIRGKKILKEFDDEITENLMKQMKVKGVKFIVGQFPLDINIKNGIFNVSFKNNKIIKYEKVMEAVGRDPNTDLLKIKNAKIKTKKNGSIIIDNYFRTSTKNIYAIGDVVDRVQLTPVAIAEAMVLIENLIAKRKKKLDYKNIPTAVFSNPNYAFVGYSESEAKKLFKKIDVYKSKFRPLKYSLSNLKENVFIKLIVNKVNDKILGIHYIGENAAEIIQGFSVAIVNGLTKKELDRTIGIHPTSAEEIVTLRK
ncbi:MAG: glutathione-disulfide reductase [Pseudomonadota bacterium]|nr:glutathione-disulfide reductase [Pseudomonadota bacterium]